MPTDTSLPKSERLHSKKLIDQLFNGGASKSMSSFPLRMVYMPSPKAEGDEAGASQMLISVPKRCFKRANKRNRVKRQVREAYRHSKSILKPTAYTIAFIWLDNQLHSTDDVKRHIDSLLTRLKEKEDIKESSERSEA